MDDVTNVYIPSSCKNTSIWLLVSTCFNPSQKHWPIWIATPFLGWKKNIETYWNHQPAVQDPIGRLLLPEIQGIPTFGKLFKKGAEFKPQAGDNQITPKPSSCDVIKCLKLKCLHDFCHLWVPTSPPEPDSPAAASRSPVRCRLPRTSTLSRRGHLGSEINMAFASSDRQVGPQKAPWENLTGGLKWLKSGY